MGLGDHHHHHDGEVILLLMQFLRCCCCLALLPEPVMSFQYVIVSDNLTYSFI